MKKVLSVCLALILLFTTSSVVLGANDDNFIYTLNSDGTCTVTGFKDRRADLIHIPSQINGKKVTAIGKDAFRTNNIVQTVIIPETVISIGSMAFYDCGNLTSVVIGDNVKSVGALAFNSCVNLTEIDLKNVQTLGEHAFYGCTALKKVYLGEGLKVIGKYAFDKCPSLNFVEMSDQLLYIDDYAFAGCPVTAISFPDKLGYIGKRAFAGCSALSSVTFGTGELTIAAYAFENCVALTEITIPDNVIEIGRCAFAMREENTPDFTHNIKIYCNLNSAAVIYAKSHGISVIVNGTEQSYENFGDVDNDGEITTSDALRLLHIAASIEPYPSDDKVFICDMNDNGTIDTDDVRITLKIAAGLI